MIPFATTCGKRWAVSGRLSPGARRAQTGLMPVWALAHVRALSLVRVAKAATQPAAFVVSRAAVRLLGYLLA